MFADKIGKKRPALPRTAGKVPSGDGGTEAEIPSNDSVVLHQPKNGGGATNDAVFVWS